MKIVIVISLFVIQGAFASSSGNYHVPCPTELMQYCDFEIEKGLVQEKNNELTVKYKLPLEIVQPQIAQIQLNGKVNSSSDWIKLENKEYGDSAQCLRLEQGLTCLVQYGFKTDLNEVEKYLKLKYPDSFEARSKVARLFSNEPSGIVVLELK